MGGLKRYIWNVLIGLDQLANTLVAGDPDMTLSGNMGRHIRMGKCWLCRPICWLLHLVDKHHCAKQDVAEADEGRDAVIKP